LTDAEKRRLLRIKAQILKRRIETAVARQDAFRLRHHLDETDRSHA
jgi:hypothetical protein